MFWGVIEYRISILQTWAYVLALLFTCCIYSSNPSEHLLWVKHFFRCRGYHIECVGPRLYSHGVSLLVPWVRYWSFLNFCFHCHNSGHFSTFDGLNWRGGHTNQPNRTCTFKCFTNPGEAAEMDTNSMENRRCCERDKDSVLWGALNSAWWQGDWSEEWVREGFLEEEHLNAICRVNQAKTYSQIHCIIGRENEKIVVKALISP